MVVTALLENKQWVQQIEVGDWVWEVEEAVQLLFLHDMDLFSPVKWVTLDFATKIGGDIEGTHFTGLKQFLTYGVMLTCQNKSNLMLLTENLSYCSCTKKTPEEYGDSALALYLSLEREGGPNQQITQQVILHPT